MVHVVVAEAAEIEVGKRLGRILRRERRRRCGARSTNGPSAGRTRGRSVPCTFVNSDEATTSLRMTSDHRCPFSSSTLPSDERTFVYDRSPTRLIQRAHLHRDVLVLRQLIEMPGDAAVDVQRQAARLVEEQQFGVAERRDRSRGGSSSSGRRDRRSRRCSSAACAFQSKRR